MNLNDATARDANCSQHGEPSPVARLAQTLLIRGAFVLALLVGGFLIAPASSKAAAPSNLPDSLGTVDVVDVYVGAINMNRCCDCHKSVC